MKKIGIAFLILCVLAVAAFFGVRSYAQTRASREVDQIISQLPELKSSEHEPVEVSLLDRTLVIPNLRLTFAKDPQTVEIGRLELQGADTKQIEAVLNGEADIEPKPVAESYALEDVRIFNKKGILRVDSYKVTDARLGKLPFKPGAERFDPKTLPELLKAIAVGRIDISGFKFKESQDKTDSLSIDRVVLDEMAGDRFKLLTVKNLKAVPDAQSVFSIDQIEAKNLHYESLLKSIAEQDTTSGSEQTMIGFERIDFTGIQVSTPKAQTVNISGFSFSNFNQRGQLPVSLNIDLNQLEVKVDGIKDEEAKGRLKGLGYDAVGMDANLNYGYDEPAKQFGLNNLSISFKDAARVSLKFKLDGVDLTNVSDADGLFPVLGAMMIKNFEFDLVDASLTERLLQMMAKDQGISVEEVRNQLIEQVEALKAGLEESPKMVQALDALVAFIKDPKSLKVTASPKSAVPVMMTAFQAKDNPEKAAAMLNLKVTANGSEPASGGAGALATPPAAPETGKKKQGGALASRKRVTTHAEVRSKHRPHRHSGGSKPSPASAGYGAQAGIQDLFLLDRAWELGQEKHERLGALNCNFLDLYVSFKVIYNCQLAPGGHDPLDSVGQSEAKPNNFSFSLNFSSLLFT